jgi:hypothetical protein
MRRRLSATRMGDNESWIHRRIGEIAVPDHAGKSDAFTTTKNFLQVWMHVLHDRSWGMDGETPSLPSAAQGMDGETPSLPNAAQSPTAPVQETSEPSIKAASKQRVFGPGENRW